MQNLDKININDDIQNLSVSDRHYLYWPRILKHERKLCPSPLFSLHAVSRICKGIHLAAFGLCLLVGIVVVVSLLRSINPQNVDFDENLLILPKFFLFFVESVVVFEILHRVFVVIDVYRRATRKTSGTIVDLYEASVEGKRKSFAIIQFAAQNKTWHMRWQVPSKLRYAKTMKLANLSVEKCNKMAVGDTVTVLYNPEAPATNIAEYEVLRTKEMLKNKVLITLFGVVVAMIALPFLLMWLHDLMQIVELFVK